MTLLLHAGLIASLLLGAAAAAAAVTLEPSKPAPALVGEVVTWTAKVPGNAADYVYRFRVRRSGGLYRTVVDFSADNTFDWTDAEHEGRFDIEVTARSRSAGDSSTATAKYVLNARVQGGSPVISRTTHPLVLLYSAPACAPPGRMKVRFQSAEGFRQETPYKECAAGATMNFYLAGLRAETAYIAYHVLDTGDDFGEGPMVFEMTGAITEDLVASEVVTPAPAGSPYPILLQECVFTDPFALDLQGRVVWYLPYTVAYMTRPEPGGRFFTITQDTSGDLWRQYLQDVDLTGRAILTTSVGRVNEQLQSLGRPAVTSFHHEALRLAGGRIAVVASIERIVTDQQGPGPVNVLGDAIVVLDRDLKVVWFWNIFDFLDVKRLATTGDVCMPNACPPLTLAPQANDWTHVNSVVPTPDGNLLVSVRDQDWVLKIDYQQGEGSGKILWRLGKDGDFRLVGAAADAWFSHQHDARYEPGSDTRLMILDNGNTRHDTDPAALSRGQVYVLDEQNRTATLVLSTDLPYSLALGSTELLPNGNYQFVAGFLPGPQAISEEVDPHGKTVFSMRSMAPVYRSYRLPDLYSGVK